MKTLKNNVSIEFRTVFSEVSFFVGPPVYKTNQESKPNESVPSWEILVTLQFAPDRLKKTIVFTQYSGNSFIKY